MVKELDTGWARWIRHHGALFGMTSGPDSETLYAWATVFALAGRQPDELIVASNRMAMNFTRPDNKWASAMQWRESHLHSLKMALRDADSIEEARRSSEEIRLRSEQSCANCRACQDSGWVLVPSVKTFQGRKRRGTCAVLCRCPVGARRWESCRDLAGTRPWSIEQYEDKCRSLGVDWRQLAEEWRQEAQARVAAEAEQRMAELRASATARKADQLQGALASVVERSRL